MQKYVIDCDCRQVFESNGLKIPEVLKKAQLPSGLFLNDKVLMTSDEYYRFMEAVGSLLPNAESFIKLAAGKGMESFSPPVFAAFCSANGKDCLDRLARYKKLIGPMEYNVSMAEDSVVLQLDSADGHTLSPTLVVEEFFFLLNLLRKASQKAIKPVLMQVPLQNPSSVFNAYVGTEVQTGVDNRMVFEKKDMFYPFVYRNEPMWRYFPPELNRRLSSMCSDASTASKVRCALSELLPAGKNTVQDVAKKLHMTKHAVRMKLHNEGTTFQKQLNFTRELLAKHYLKDTTMDTNDIAFLLGYEELNSFLRAFSSWTGQSISEFRRASMVG